MIIYLSNQNIWLPPQPSQYWVCYASFKLNSTGDISSDHMSLVFKTYTGPWYISITEPGILQLHLLTQVIILNRIYLTCYTKQLKSY